MRGRTVKSPERVAEAQRMRAEGYSLKVIAQCFGIGVSTAQQWVTDPNGSKMRERREKYMAPCVDCSKPVWAYFGGESRKVPERCVPCANRHARESGRRADMVRTHERAERIVAWWAAGWTSGQIAAELGWSTSHLSMEMDRLRKKGYDLPYRRSAEHVEAIRAGIAARKAAA